VTQGISGSRTRYSFYDPMDTLLSESALTSSGKPSIVFDYIEAIAEHLEREPLEGKRFKEYVAEGLAQNKDILDALERL
jgi:hypothetical protein